MYYYPVETIAAMLNSVMGTAEKVAHYINFAESQGVQVLPPNINESYSKFTVKGDTIRFGLAAIRNVGINVIESVVKSRSEKGSFESLVDFITKIDLSSINKRAVESLIKSGAFDDFNTFRSKLLAVYEKIMDSVSNEKKRNIDGQISLFGIAEDTLQQPEINYPNIKEFPKNAMLNMEKEMTGLYLSGHPLDEYAHSLKMCTSVSIDKIYKSQEAQQDGVEDEYSIHDDDKVVLGGIISEVNQKVTRNNSIMAFLRFEDLTASIEVIVFPKTLDRVRNLIAADSLVVIKGRVSMKEDEPVKLICETIEPLEKVNSSKIYLRVDNLEKAKELKPSLIKIANNYKGDTPIYVFTSNDRKNYRMPREMWVNDESSLFIELREVFGEDNVKVVE